MMKGPVIPAFVIFKMPRPVFVSVTVCGALVVDISCVAKVRLLGESVTAATTPVPVSVTVCGLFGALSETLTAAFRVPVAVGLKYTDILQLAPADTDVPQVFVWEKSPLFVPVMLITAVNAMFPVFFSVTV